MACLRGGNFSTSQVIEFVDCGEFAADCNPESVSYEECDLLADLSQPALVESSLQAPWHHRSSRMRKPPTRLAFAACPRTPASFDSAFTAFLYACPEFRYGMLASSTPSMVPYNMAEALHPDTHDAALWKAATDI